MEAKNAVKKKKASHGMGSSERGLLCDLGTGVARPGMVQVPGVQ